MLLRHKKEVQDFLLSKVNRVNLKVNSREVRVARLEDLGPGESKMIITTRGL